MKKSFLFFLIITTGLLGFSQRFEVTTSTFPFDYKKHYTHSIEGGFVNGQARQFIAGNETDYGFISKRITGHPIDGVNFLTGRTFIPITNPDVRIQLTDFTIYPTEDYQYGAGTGIYYPNGITSSGYPFLGIYDKTTMAVISAMYYDLSYPGMSEATSAVGLRVKYSRDAQSFYISGVMVDRLFSEINLNNIVGKSKGFILKVDPNGLSVPQVLFIEPDNLPGAPYDPILCSVHDLEFSADGQSIAFTGITTKDNFNGGYYHPLVGMIDLNLGVQWCNAYDFPSDRYSGVEVEFNTDDNKLLVLTNSSRYLFAVMELDYLAGGSISQMPVTYEFSMGSIGSARAHIMHYNSGEIVITGNCFVPGILINSPEDQLLFSYTIPTASYLLSGNPTFNSYSRQEVPTGSQKATSGYWAPENSIYQEGNLSIVGVYNNNNITFGYTLIEVNGFVNQEGCLETGAVRVENTFQTDYETCEYTTGHCNQTGFLVDNPGSSPNPPQECPVVGKSISVSDGNISGLENLWQYKGIDARGIHAILYSESNNTRYEVVVYDMMGRKITSSSYNVSGGQQEIYLEFAAKAEMYVIRVSNGSQSQTMKVAGN